MIFSLLFISNLINPFEKQKIKKDFRFYLHWTLSIILFPIGIIRIIIFLLLASITAIINQIPQISQKNKLKFTSFNCKLVCLSSGFIIKNKIPKQIKLQNQNIICNHQSSLDPVILLTIGIGNFLAKEEILTFPLFSQICRGIGCVFVPQANKKDERHQFSQKLKNLMEKGQKVTIFPEGTTSRCDTLLYFQRGAFQSNDKLQALYIRWDTRYQTCSDCWQGMELNLLKLLFSLYTRVQIEYLGEIDQNEDIQLRIDQAVQRYEKHMGVKAIKVRGFDKRYIRGGYKNGECKYEDLSDYMKQLIEQGVVKLQ